MNSKWFQNKYIPIIVFMMFGLLVYMQHHFVYMYFDDYGYASLTYGYSVGNGGLDYSFGDILKFLTWHYLNWGGRIIPFFAEIIILKQGVWLIRIIQTLIIVGIYGVMYKLLETSNNKKNVFNAIILVSLFASIGISQVKSGIYWYTASVLYVWPAFFFLFFIWFQNKQVKKRNDIFWGAIFLFLTGFSYEQYAVIVIVYALFSLISNWVTKHANNREDILICVSGMAGAVLELLAPGNFVRNNNNLYTEFYETPFITRTLKNLEKIVQINLGNNNGIYVFIICFALTGVISNLFSSGKISRKIRNISIGATAILIVAYILGSIKNIPNMVIIEGCIAINFLFFSVMYFIYSKRYYCVGLLVAGICSQGMMLVTPAIVERCALPFTFIMHLLLAIELADGYITGRFLFNVLGGLLVITSWVNYGKIFCGYMNNSTINEINHYKLVEKSSRIMAGEDIDKVILYKLNDDTYASDMPYQQDYMEYWWKEYYDLPQEVQFIWIGYQDQSNCHEKVVFDKIELLSVWPDVINEKTQFNEDGSVNIAAIPNIISKECKIVVNGEIFNTTVDDGFISTTIPASMLRNDLEISVVNSITEEYTNSIVMSVQLEKNE